MSPAFLIWQMGWQDLPCLGEQVGWSTDRNAGESAQQATALAPKPDDSGTMGGGFNPSCPRRLPHSLPVLLLPPSGPTSCGRGIQKVSAWRSRGSDAPTVHPPRPCDWLWALRQEVTRRRQRLLQAQGPGASGAKAKGGGGWSP